MKTKNQKIKAVRKFHFCSGHRVFKHESKCNKMHGHNYTMYAYAEASELDSVGRVIDFSEIKRRLGDWIEDKWDHKFLVYIGDEDVLKALRTVDSGESIYLCSFNPTAENMASFILNRICPDVFKGTGITITKIELWETDNCKVEVTLG